MEPLDSGTLMAALSGTAIYVSLMPSLADIRKAETDSATARDVRNGIVVGSLALVGTGLLMSIAALDARPFWLSFGIAILMGTLFEATLRLDGETG